MKVYCRVGLVLFSVVTVACGVDAPHRGLGAQHPSEAPSEAKRSSDSEEAKAPQLMIARVAVDEADSESAHVEFVSLDNSVTIGSAQDAARAFESGQPMSVSADGSLALGKPVPTPVQSPMATPAQVPAKVEIGAPVQAPVQMGTPCTNPCGDKVPPRGGFLSVAKARTVGFFSRVGGLLQGIKPRVLLGDGVDYQSANQLAGERYQYTVYKVAPGKPQNVPVQGPAAVSPAQVPVPGPRPVPGPQQPTYMPPPAANVPGGNPATPPRPTGGGR